MRAAVTVFLALVAGVAAGILGWFLTGIAAVILTGFAGMSDFEGQRGMVSFFGIGPIGGLAAMVVAVWLVVRSRREDRPRAAATVSAGRSDDGDGDDGGNGGD